MSGQTTQEAWTRIQDKLRQQFGEHRFNTWLGNVHLIALTEDRLELGIQNRFHGDYIEERYKDVLLDTVEEMIGYRPELHFTISGFLFRRHRAHQEAIKAQTQAEISRRRKNGTSQGTAGKRHDTSQIFFLKYRLETFIAGECNKIAYAQAKRILRNPGSEKTNPLTVYGGHGLGKTHLLQGIANGLTERYTAAARDGQVRPKVLYVTSEYFTNRFTTALQVNKMEAFREEFRTPAALIVDDLHHLTGKPRSAEAFLHAVDDLLDHGAQVVVSALTHPRNIRGLPQALTNRLEGGMTAKLDLPDHSTRLALIRQLLGPEKRQYSSRTIELLAERLTGSIREIKGHLNKLVAFLDVSGERVTPELVDQILSDLFEYDVRAIELSDIENGVIARMGVSSQQLHSTSRKREIAVARQMCMYLARHLTDFSLNEIGKYFGGKNHATVVFSEKKIRKAMEINEELREHIAAITTALSNPAQGKGTPTG